MTDRTEPLSIDDAAVLCGSSAAEISRLIKLGLLPCDGLSRQDHNGIRLIQSFEHAGINLQTIADAVKAGLVSMEFTRHLMPDSIVLSVSSYADVCADLGIEFNLLRRLFIAAGLPAPNAARPAREDEVSLLRLVVATLQRGASEQAVAGILRVFGQATRRIAEAMREFFRSEIETRLEAQGLSSGDMMTAAALHRVPLQSTGFEALRLMSARFLEEMVFENSTMRIQDILTANALLEPVGIADPAVGFVDLAGFSALTRAIGDVEAAARAGQFEALAQESIATHGGRIIKFLGDGLLVLFPKADCAPKSCRELMHELARYDLPAIHVGLTVGPVIRRDGDIFGNSVNLAARLASLAAPSEIFADAASLEWLGGTAAGWRAGGAVTPKGMAEIHIIKLDQVTLGVPARQHTQKTVTGRHSGIRPQCSFSPQNVRDGT